MKDRMKLWIRSPLLLFISHHPRTFPKKIPAVDYDSSATVRFVRTNGEIKWKSNKIYLSGALIGQYVALTQTDNYLWKVNYSFYPLGFLDEVIMRMRKY